jgi:hypothetical protein
LRWSKTSHGLKLFVAFGKDSGDNNRDITGGKLTALSRLKDERRREKRTIPGN